jgi:Ala-tRNA(Pro) deacylase
MSIREYLRSQSVPFTMLLHPPAPSAARRAQSVHVPGARVAKGVLVRAGTGYVLAVVPATHRVDLDRLAPAIDRSPGELRIATEDEVESVFADCERGALPPFGHLYGLLTVVDSSLAAVAEIVVEGNTRHEGLRLRYRDYEAAAGPIHARFATPIARRRRGPAERRAG